MDTRAKVFLLLVFSALGVPASCQGDDSEFLYGKFSDSFTWGTATSAYQIEGGWDADGKGENIWDRFSSEGRVANNDTGDVACDSYNKWAEDIRIMTEIGVQNYRFSLSWARMVPTGRVAEGINEPGILYYSKLIDGLIAAGVTPMVTLYHWDLPQSLQDVGGWHNVTIVQHFEDFADLAYSRYGDRVKLWITFNEPWVTCWLGYGNGVHAPGLKDEGKGGYKCAHVIHKSHAEAWHLYDDTYRATQGGQVSITLDSDWKEPKTDTDADRDAAIRGMEFKLGWFANPIFGSGDYPEVMKTNIAAKSEAQGLNESRLPAFTPAEVARIKGTHDFFGLNHYTSYIVTAFTHPPSCVSYNCDPDYTEEQDPSWPTTGSSWLKMVPWGLRKLMNHIKDFYGDVPIFITENGCSDRNSSLQDTHRVNFYRGYINEALKANLTDGVNVMAYTAWSLMDNFEWASGYDEKFGIHWVNFSDPARPRIQKESARQYAQIIRDNGFPAPSDVTTEGSGDPGENGQGGLGAALISFLVPLMLVWIRA